MTEELHPAVTHPSSGERMTGANQTTIDERMTSELLFTLTPRSQPRGGLQATPEQRVDTVASYFGELMNEGRLELIDTLMTPEVVLRLPNQSEPLHGREAVRRFVTDVRAGAPHIRFTVERGIVQGNKVVARWRSEGMSEGLDVFVFEGGRVAEIRVGRASWAS